MLFKRSTIAITYLLFLSVGVGCSDEAELASRPVSVYPVHGNLYPEDLTTSDAVVNIQCRPVEGSSHSIRCDKIIIEFERPELAAVSPDYVKMTYSLHEQMCSRRINPGSAESFVDQPNMGKDYDVPLEFCYQTSREEKERIVVENIHRLGGDEPRNCAPRIKTVSSEIYKWDEQLSSWVYTGDRIGICETRAEHHLKAYSDGFAWTYSEFHTVEHPDRIHHPSNQRCSAQAREVHWDTRGKALQHCARIGETWSQ